MSNLAVTEIKAFVPSRNFELSKQFYKDLGFTMASEGGGIAYFHLGHVCFLLQDFCAESLAENFMMHHPGRRCECMVEPRPSKLRAHQVRGQSHCAGRSAVAHAGFLSLRSIGCALAHRAEHSVMNRCPPSVPLSAVSAWQINAGYLSIPRPKWEL